MSLEGQAKLNITEEARSWIDSYLLWLIDIYGTENLKKEGFIYPVEENFPVNLSGQPQNVLALIKIICEKYNVKYDDVTVKLLEQGNAKKWHILKKGREDTTGVVVLSNGNYEIHFSPSISDNLPQAVATIAIEACYVKMLSEHVFSGREPDLEMNIELASVFFGFGIFMCNAETRSPWDWIRKVQFMDRGWILYAMAFISFIKGKEETELKHFISSEFYSLYKEAFGFISLPDNAEPLKSKIDESDFVYRCYAEFKAASKSKEYKKAISALELLRKTFPDTTATHNNIGYTFLLDGNFEHAIKEFNSAIDLDPYFDYAFNNRGYCYLLLNKMEDAKTDLDCALNMNLLNAFNHRNLGLYYLKTSNCSLALKFFEEALRLDPRTEIIHFCYGLYYHLSGEKEKAAIVFKRSDELNEHEGKKDLKIFFGLGLIY